MHWPNSLMTDMAMGSIMAVVAVLLSHIDRKAVMTMKPSRRVKEMTGEDSMIIYMNVARRKRNLVISIYGACMCTVELHKGESDT